MSNATTLVSDIHGLISQAAAACAAKDGRYGDLRCKLDAKMAELLLLAEAGESATRVLWFMQNGWTLMKMNPSSDLTDEANAEYAWMCSRNTVPYCTNARGGSRIWSGHTAEEALEKSVAELEQEYPSIRGV